MKNLTSIGRILYAIPFAVFGIMHFVATQAIVEMSSLIPLGIYTVFLTGAFLIAAAVSIALNKFVQLFTILLAALLLVFIALVHVPNLFSDVETVRIIGMTNLLKDMALMGASLIISGVCKMKKEMGIE